MFEKGFTPSSTHPPLPPTSEDERFSRLRLLRSRRVGISTYHRLMAEFGSAQAALEALPDVAAKAGERGYRACDPGRAARELADGKAVGARLLHQDDPEFPGCLGDLAHMPPMLWCLGQVDLMHRPALSLVGARNASSNGTRMARKMAHALGEAGQVIVSGLARGIDTAAHLGSLETGTIAVVAGGVDVTYPLENAELADKIKKTGLLISEVPMGTQPMARHFPARNRLISALGQATIVVEAAARSGSLITARDALDIGRDVMAVPGHPFDGRAGGCNLLIRDGALLVRHAEDVLDALRPIAAPEAPKKPRQPALDLRSQNALHQQVLERLGPAPLPEDQLIRDLATTASNVAPILIELELNGLIDRQPGGLLIRNSAS
ncbi:MAG: DNA-protecting protein DprA [Rhodobacteraceae bacterium]|nr:DNA-protecting protein DprA [Paracoccaceae bacterium]